MTFDLGAISTGLNESEPGYWVGKPAERLHYDPGRSLHWREAEDRSGWHQHRSAVLCDVLRRYPPGGVLFDVGGGNGFVSRALADAGFPTVLVEPTTEAARTAYARGVRPVVCSTIEDAGLSRESVAAFGLFDVIEHLDDDLGQLQRLHDLLRPGGRLYITVPKHRWLWSLHDEQAGHQRRYSTRELLERVRSAGYEPEYHTSLFRVLLVPMVVRRALGSRRLGRGAAGIEDPTGADGLVARWLRARLARERSGLQRRPRRAGTSVLLVARAVPSVSIGS